MGIPTHLFHETFRRMVPLGWARNMLLLLSLFGVVAFLTLMIHDDSQVTRVVTSVPPLNEVVLRVKC